MLQLRDYQSGAIQQLRDGFAAGHRSQILVAPTGSGKCLGFNTPLIMADGTIKMVQDVQHGDQLLGPDGLPRNVLSLARGREMLYRINQVKGDSYVVNESHILSLRNRYGIIKNISVLDYLEKPHHWKRQNFGWRVSGITYGDLRPELLQIDSVVLIGVGDYYGFEIDGDKLFLLGDFTVTHNTEIAIALLEAARKKGSRAAMLLDRIVLCDQTSKRLDKYDIDHGVLQSGHWRYRPQEPIQVCSAQTLEKRGSFPGLSLLIVDECFPGETLVETPNGKKRIDSIRDGEVIYNAIGVGIVRSTFSKTIYQTVLVRLSNGTTFECTKDHPIFTEMGWKSAGSLAGGEKLFCREEVRILWEGNYSFNYSLKERRDHSGSRNFVQKEAVLQHILREEAGESYAPFGMQTKGKSNLKKDWSQAHNARREWSRNYKNRKNDDEQTFIGLDTELCCKDIKKTCSRLSASLQTGYSLSKSKNMLGIRWEKSWIENSARTGQEKRFIAKGVWVESVQNIEHPSGKNVFNLRVSGHPSYFANGLLVHNCHQGRKQTIEFIKANPDVKVIGLTATPFTKGLGQIYTNIVSPVTTKDLVASGALVPLRVFIAKEIDMEGAKKVAGEWSAAEAETRGMKITGDVVAEWIKKTHEIYGKPMKTIVFASGVDHAADLSKKFAEQGYNFIAISYKDDDQYKRDVIEDFGKPDTEINGLIATDILTKGFDVADTHIAISARPFSKSLSSHVQQMGRVMRSHPSKSFAVWLDHAGNYLRFREDWDAVFEDGVHELDDGKEKAKKEKTKKEKEAAKCPKCGALWKGGDMCGHCGHVRERKSMVSSVPGELSELAAMSRDNKQDFWSAMVYKKLYAGWSDGRCAHTYKDKFGTWPKGLADTPKIPSPEVEKFIKHRLMVYLKSKKRA